MRACEDGFMLRQQSYDIELFTVNASNKTMIRTRYISFIASLLLIAVVVLSIQNSVAAVPYTQQEQNYLFTAVVQTDVLYAEVNSQDTTSPQSGTLVLPATRLYTEEKPKQCMTVCGRWGEECMFINRGTGGTTKKCRRACKKFVEECF